MNKKKVTKYCAGCKKRHSVEVGGWEGWSSSEINGKKVYFCRKHMHCVGCGTIHERTGFSRHRTKEHPETGEKLGGWWCEKWERPAALTPEQRMANMSPQEVVSGVHLGMDRQEVWGEDTDDWSRTSERTEGLKELEEVLSE